MRRFNANDYGDSFSGEKSQYLHRNIATRQKFKSIGSAGMKSIVQLQDALLDKIINTKDEGTKKTLRDYKSSIDELFKRAETAPFCFQLDDEEQQLVDLVSSFIMNISDTAVSSSIEPQCPANTSIGASSSHSLFSAPASDNKSSSESASKHEDEYNYKP